MYEVINEELCIMACDLEDLTAEQVMRFLGGWKDGARIGTLKSYKRGKNNGTIEIEVDASPYKYSRFATDQEVEWDTFDFTNGILQCLKDIAVDGTTEVKAVGYAENTVPVISVTGTVSVTYDGITTALPEGKNKILSITIREGENTLIFTGKGTVTIEYRGGSL